MAKHKTPLLDQLESGPWPSFVSDMKQQAEKRAKNEEGSEFQVPQDGVEDLLGVRKDQVDVACPGRCLELAARRDTAIEAATIADVAARAAFDIHAQPDAVLVVVDQEFTHGLHEAAGGSLVPEHLAAAAPVMGLAGFQGLVPGGLIDVGQHQHLAGLVVLVLLIVVGIFGEAIAPYGLNEIDIANRLAAPSGRSARRWFGPTPRPCGRAR